MRLLYASIGRACRQQARSNGRACRRSDQATLTTCADLPASPTAPINYPPVVANQTYSVPRDKILSIAAPGVLTGASDVDGGTVTVAGYGLPLHGTLTGADNGSFVYVPAAGFSGADSFTFNATDGQGGYALGSVFLTISERFTTGSKGVHALS
jgi:hypothetical protein